MSTKILKILYIYFLIILIGAFAPFLFVKDYKFQTSLDIIRTLSILATSTFALIYFDPFSLKKKKIENQYENVTKILEAFIGQRIVVKYKLGKNMGFANFFIKREMIFSPNMISYLNEFNNEKIIFQLANLIESQVELIKLKNHLWSPK